MDAFQVHSDIITYLTIFCFVGTVDTLLDHMETRDGGTGMLTGATSLVDELLHHKTGS